MEARSYEKYKETEKVWVKFWNKHWKTRLLIMSTILGTILVFNPNAEIGFSPFGIPIRVSINHQGNLAVEISDDLLTPVGRFDWEISADVYPLQALYDSPVLIICVDKEISVYELEPDKNFRVVFDNKNTLYEKVDLEHNNGSFILQLKSITPVQLSIPKTSTPLVITSVVTSAPIVVTSTPTATPTTQDQKDYAIISCEEDITQAALRKSPGYQTKDDSLDIIYKIDCGERLELLGESQKADGLTWWHVSWHEYTGWMADHTGRGRTILLFD